MICIKHLICLSGIKDRSPRRSPRRKSKVPVLPNIPTARVEKRVPVTSERERTSHNFTYTVGLLLHRAKRQRPMCGLHLESCRCEDYHVIELRLVAAALNQLPFGTYCDMDWQTRLVDFFDREFQGSTYLSHYQRQQKIRAVDNWLAGHKLTTEEVKLIDKIRNTWADVRNTLSGFKEFKGKFDDILDKDHSKKGTVQSVAWKRF